jgi:hypothetical protein
MTDDVSNLCEPALIPDSFCTDLTRIERIGPCVRLTFTVPQGASFGSARTENHVIAKLVLPADALPRIARALLADAAEIPELQLAPCRCEH